MDAILKCTILAVIIPVCSSCMCEPSHLQTRFCTSSFVLRVKVIRESLPSAKKVKPIGGVLDYVDTIPPDAKWVYDVDVIDAYKVPKGSNIKKGNVMQATTDTMMSCGERLRDKSQEYLLSGWDDDGKLNFETCDFPTAFSNISPEQLAGLKGEYQCGCKITSEILLNPKLKKPACSLPYSCLDNYLKHGMCKESNDNGCVWDIADEYICKPEYLVQK